MKQARRHFAVLASFRPTCVAHQRGLTHDSFQFPGGVLRPAGGSDRGTRRLRWRRQRRHAIEDRHPAPRDHRRSRRPGRCGRRPVHRRGIEARGWRGVLARLRGSEDARRAGPARDCARPVARRRVRPRRRVRVDAAQGQRRSGRPRFLRHDRRPGMRDAHPERRRDRPEAGSRLHRRRRHRHRFHDRLQPAQVGGAASRPARGRRHLQWPGLPAEARAAHRRQPAGGHDQRHDRCQPAVRIELRRLDGQARQRLPVRTRHGDGSRTDRAGRRRRQCRPTAPIRSRARW